MSRRSLALGSLLAGSLLAAAVPWTDSSGGHDLTRALALVALAGTGLVLVLGGRGRRLIGLVLAVLGLAMALAGALLSGTAISWQLGYAGGGVLVTSGGLLTLITGGRWPARADRFEQNPPDLWQALDAGLDPTADPDVRKDDLGDTMRSANQSQQSSGRK
jgi:hypothetical protein